jgi:hypothetical protein
MSHDSRVPVQYYNFECPVGSVLRRLFCEQACVPAPPGVIVVFLTRLPVCVPATLGVSLNFTIGTPGDFLPVR